MPITSDRTLVDGDWWTGGNLESGLGSDGQADDPRPPDHQTPDHPPPGPARQAGPTGQPPEKPRRYRRFKPHRILYLRVDPAIHRWAIDQAGREGLSVNEFIGRLLRERMG